MVLIADRSVMVKLLANVQGFVAGIAQAQAATTQLGTKFKAESETVGRGLMGIGVAAGAGVGIAVAKFAEFDQAMSFVQAATHESASNMNLLRDAALDAGAKTVFSAQESANAIEELAKAGISTADILGGGLSGALDLAAAGGLGVADAAAIAATALTQFKLNGSDVPHVADLLAAGAGKAQGSVQDLSAALNQGGLVASQTGLTIEETTGTLAAFASAGLLGSDAGTSFKTMLQRLTPQSAEAKNKMKELGISAYDAQGQFVGMQKFAGQLQGALKDLTPEARNSALGVIFGSDAVRAASVIYEQGAKGIGEWVSAVDDSGYAAETAAMRLDNLAGDTEALGGAFDTAFIKAGSASNDVLRGMVQVATGLVDAYSQLPMPVQQGALVLGTLVAVVGLAGGAFLLAVPKIVEFRAALSTLNTAFPAVGNAARGVAGFLTGPWGIALTLATVALGIFAGRQAASAASVKELAGTLDEQTGAFTSNTRAAVVKKLSDDGVFEAAKRAGVGQKELTDAVLQGGAALDTVLKKVGDTNTIATFFEGTGIAAGMASQSIRDLAGDVSKTPAAFKDSQEAMKGAAQATQDNSAALDELSGKANIANADVDDLADAIRNFGSAQLDVNSAAREFEAAIDSLSDSLAENGTTLDITSAAGRSNQAAVDALAKSTLDYAAATYTQTGSQAAANQVIANGRQALINQLAAFGIVGDAAEAYANSLGLVPSDLETAARVTGIAQAEADLDTLTRQREAIIVARTRDGGGSFATGGFTGAGGKYEPAGTVHRGEFVSTKETVANPANRAALEYMQAGGSMSGFSRGYADGGYVSPAEGGYVGSSFMPQQQRIYINSQIITPQGDLIGIVQGEVDRGLSMTFAEQKQTRGSGYRRN